MTISISVTQKRQALLKNGIKPPSLVQGAKDPVKRAQSLYPSLHYKVMLCREIERGSRKDHPAHAFQKENLAEKVNTLSPCRSAYSQWVALFGSGQVTLAGSRG